MRIGEYGEIIESLITILRKANIPDGIIVRLLIYLVTAKAVVEQAIVAIRLDQRKGVLFGLDVVRDDDYKFLNGRIEQFEHKPHKKALFEAYTKLWQIVQRIGVQAHKLGYREQNTAFDSYISEMQQPENQAHLETLGLVGDFNDLVASHGNFKAEWESSKTSEDTRRTYPTVAEAKQYAAPYIRATLNSCELLEIEKDDERHADVEGKPDPKVVQELIDELNKVITEQMAIIRARETKKENERESAKEENTPPAEDGDAPVEQDDTDDMGAPI